MSKADEFAVAADVLEEQGLLQPARHLRGIVDTDCVLVVLESTPDSMFDAQEIQDVRDIVKCTLDPTLDPGTPNVGVIQLPPGMKMRLYGGTEIAVRKLQKVIVEQVVR